MNETDTPAGLGSSGAVPLGLPAQNMMPEPAAQNTPDEELGDIRFGFSMDDLSLLLMKGLYSEFIEMPAICPIPNTPTWLFGVSNLRGAVYPIFDFYFLLGLKKPPSRELGLLILDRGEKMVGFPIKGSPVSVKGLLPQTENMLPSLPARLTGCISDAYFEGRKRWLEFDHEAFFSSLIKEIGM